MTTTEQTYSYDDPDVKAVALEMGLERGKALDDDYCWPVESVIPLPQPYEAIYYSPAHERKTEITLYTRLVPVLLLKRNPRDKTETAVVAGCMEAEDGYVSPVTPGQLLGVVPQGEFDPAAPGDWLEGAQHAETFRQLKAKKFQDDLRRRVDERRAKR